MNDLLELAAKAVGLNVKGRCEDEPALLIRPVGGPKSKWQPLTDDGDNRRLQTALRAALYFLTHTSQ